MGGVEGTVNMLANGRGAVEAMVNMLAMNREAARDDGLVNMLAGAGRLGITARGARPEAV